MVTAKSERRPLLHRTAAPPLDAEGFTEEPTAPTPGFEHLLRLCAPAGGTLKVAGMYDLQFIKRFSVPIADRTRASANVEDDEILSGESHCEIVTRTCQ